MKPTLEFRKHVLFRENIGEKEKKRKSVEINI